MNEATRLKRFLRKATNALLLFLSLLQVLHDFARNRKFKVTIFTPNVCNKTK